MLYALALVAVFQQQTQTQQPAAPPSPVARLVVLPASRTMVAGDTLRLTARALDASGNPVSGALIRFQAAGGRFEGTVDSAGLVRSGSTGTIPVAVIALVPGTRPVVERVEIAMVAGPAARVAIEPAVERLVVGQRLRLTGTSYSAAGDARGDRVAWRSSNAAVASVSETGQVVARAAGRVTLTASAGAASQSMTVDVVPNTIASMELRPAASEARTGDVIDFELVARDARGRPVADLYPTYSITPGNGMIDPDGKFVGYEPGDYLVSAVVGNRVAQATVRLAHRDVRRKVSVVGRLPRKLFSTEEVWIHPNGRVAYLGTGGGGDRMYAIDISNPAAPVVTDSIVANTRRVNDIMTTPDGRFLVFTREGAADRRNGIVIASLEDPLHPKPISEFTEGVTAGVHSAFVYRQEKFGTHIYLTNDGTGAMHVIDIADPYKPREVAQWKTPRADAGRSLHDLDIQNGLAYLSYWNDGLVILDVGNGMKGGSPSNPQLVSQFKYDLNDLYRQVEAVGGPGFIRGTHTAWRHRNYVFIADEVFPSSPVSGARGAAAFRAYGRLQVIDVSDLQKPKSVAWYEPEMGGVHNVWVAGDTLYLGAYNGGFRAFDISGELRGDLRAQQREMVHLHTGDMDGLVPNSPMTWGVVVNPKDGLAYVNDINNGLWIVRIEPRPAVVP
ncbi:MAG TPA: Ig-like domain-containing protein [Gemmatimonadaceae bacterium]|nr:Ig-like domain-containing protein [Gemmatimonadaceae bacterium]